MSKIRGNHRKSKYHTSAEPVVKPKPSILNIIYFIDSKQTKSLKIPLKAAGWLAGSLIIIVLWSFSSLAVLVQSYTKTGELSSKISSLKHVIFEQQVKLERVYEKTYQDHTKESDQSSAISDESSPTDHSSSNTASTNPVSVIKNPSQANEKIVAEKNSNITEDSHVKIETARIKSTQNQLELNFSIKNLDSPKQKEGNVIGVAKYIGPDGSSQLITSPPGISLSGEGRPDNLKTGFRFSIKYYKERMLFFTTPKVRGGSFEKVSIFTLDDQGNKSETELIVKNLPHTKTDDSGEASHSPTSDEDKPLIND